MRFEASELAPASGLYIFDFDTVQGIPMESNNKAHYPAGGTVASLMHTARNRGLFASMPLWPAAFADLTPPNLYQVHKERFDELFRARRRNDQPASTASSVE